MNSVLSFFLSIVMFFLPAANIPKAEPDRDAWNTNYAFIFVHGLAGWGEYGKLNKVLPYWGMFGGDLMQYLNARGYDCHAASVDPGGSAWDRACELYAQLTGTRVDYGAVHSAQCHHERFGEDYTGNALIPAFSAEDKINLLGHSFGGTTALLFAEIMANGSAEEQAAAEETSSFFAGGKGDWIYSITTLASPLNGTTAYSIAKDFDDGKLERTAGEKIFAKIIDKFGGSKQDGRISEDSAEYDMTVDRGAELISGIETQETVYYFSVPCCCTVEDKNGYQTRDASLWAEPFVRSRIERMGCYEAVSPGGIVLDANWWENDGLVNTISARAPFHAPQQDYDPVAVRPGIWNVMPTYRGDHQSLTGDMLRTNQIRTFYFEMLEMLNRL